MSVQGFPIDYFLTADTNPGADVWNVATGAYVAVNNATFLTWLTSIALPTPVQNYPYSSDYPAISAAASNGAGGTRFTVGAGQDITSLTNMTGASINIQGTTTYDGNQTFTFVDSTHFDIAQAFSVNVTSGQCYGARVISTKAAMVVLLNAFGLGLIPAPDGFYAKNIISIASNTTLSNPLTVANIVTVTANAPHVAFPPMNQPNSLPIGVPFTFTFDKASAGALTALVYNDGVTVVAGSPPWVPGVTVLMVVDDNSTVNGHITVLGWFAESNSLPVDIGGTGTNAFTVGGTIFNPGASSDSPLSSTLAGLLGQQYTQAAGINPAWRNAGTGHGNSNSGIGGAPDTLFLFTNAAFTAPRTWTLSAANGFAPGTRLMVADIAGGVTATNTLTVAPAGTDTINGVNASQVAINHAFGWAAYITDGVSAWSNADATDASNLLRGTLPDARLSNTIAAGGPTGDASHVAQITYDAHGRLTAVTSVAITPAAISAVATVKKQIFGSSGTYTPSTGMLFCIAECIGGGGGGGATVGSNTAARAGGGGGNGSYARSWLSAATIGASKTVTIGTAGSGGLAGANAGGAGGDTSLGTLVIGKGGSGGNFSDFASGFGERGAGGVSGTGDLVLPGNPGGSGLGQGTITTILANGGTGGAGYFGGAGTGAIAISGSNNAGSNAAANSGSGGGGAATVGTATNAAGGGGGTGLVVITEFCNQ